MSSKRRIDDEDEDYFERPASANKGASWLMDALKVEENRNVRDRKGTKGKGTIDTSFFTKLRQEGRGRRWTRKEERAFFRKVMDYRKRTDDN